MARITSPNLQMQRITTSRGTEGRVNFSYRLRYGINDIEQNQWHRVHVTLWERDGSHRDHIYVRYNGTGLWLKRDAHGSDDFISYVDGRWVRPNGNSSTFVSDSRSFTPAQLHEESGNEEYYLHIAAHPWSGGNVEEYSAEDPLNF
ncbi:hypothetical protein [Salinigranum sp. GCM10025319]|uniref:hypothetical protein n=1 Tax=Salinigranum sp. GCM10025319 TaxID=3252687 RepID=UPI00361DB2FD